MPQGEAGCWAYGGSGCDWGVELGKPALTHDGGSSTRGIMVLQVGKHCRASTRDAATFLAAVANDPPAPRDIRSPTPGVVYSKMNSH